MTNREKARSIGRNHRYIIRFNLEDAQKEAAYEGALEMAEWKDDEFERRERELKNEFKKREEDIIKRAHCFVLYHLEHQKAFTADDLKKELTKQNSYRY